MSSQKASPFQGGIDKVIEKSLADWNVPGLAIAIVDGDQIDTKCYGLAHVETNVLVTPQTQFYAASTTKAFVAAAVSLLVDDTKYPHISWDTPIYDILRNAEPACEDDFLLTDDYWTKHITLEDALCHRTGYPRHDYSLARSEWTTRDVIRSFRHLPSTRDPRTSFQYCNMMYVAVQYAIEHATGMTLPKFMQKHIWDPLEMTKTTDGIDHTLPKSDQLAMGYYSDPNKEHLTESGQPFFPAGFGAGGMITNVSDLAKWVKTMLRRIGPMSAKAHEELVTPRMYFDAGLPNQIPARFYGLGWRMTWYFGNKVIWHTGGIQGFSALVVYIPSQDWGTTMLSNSMEGGNNAHERIMWHLIDELLEVDMSLRFDWDEKNKRKEVATTENFNKAVWNPETVHQGLSVDDDNQIERSKMPALDSFTGVYDHPAYGKLTLYVKDEALRADVLDRRSPYEMSFGRVEGDNFAVYFRYLQGDERSANKARFFRDGEKITGLALDYEQDLGPTTIDYVKLGDLASTAQLNHEI